jgi:hypothetical protein
MDHNLSIKFCPKFFFRPKWRFIESIPGVWQQSEGKVHVDADETVARDSGLGRVGAGSGTEAVGKEHFIGRIGTVMRK